jgi:hypothetical protein
LLSHIPVKLDSGEIRKFDLVSQDNNIIIECKNYSWRPRGQFPNGKNAELVNAITYLRGAPAARTILVFNDNVYCKKSLVEAFVKRNRLRLDSIEIWRATDGRFEQYADFSVLPKRSTQEQTTVDRAVNFLHVMTAKSGANQIMPIATLARLLDVPPGTLRTLGEPICGELRKLGIRASVGDQHFVLT